MLAWPGLACAVALLTGAVVEAQVPPAPISLGGQDNQRLVWCAGRDVAITGSRSAYIVRGGCRTLTVSGDLLTVQAEMQPGSRISVTGRGSVVTWSMAGHGRIPVTAAHGPGTRTQRAEPAEE